MNETDQSQKKSFIFFSFSHLFCLVDDDLKLARSADGDTKFELVIGNARSASW